MLKGQVIIITSIRVHSQQCRRNIIGKPQITDLLIIIKIYLLNK